MFIDHIDNSTGGSAYAITMRRIWSIRVKLAAVLIFGWIACSTLLTFSGRRERMDLVYIDKNENSDLLEQYFNISTCTSNLQSPSYKSSSPDVKASTAKKINTIFTEQFNFPLKLHHLVITGQVKKDKKLVIGVPTMHRGATGHQYLVHTLRSLVRHISSQERQLVTILIFLTDFDESRRAPVRSFILGEYPQHLKSGFMLVMEVDLSAYPPLENLKRNYNDAEKRVKWRAKQVVDFAFMFYVGKDLSEYYMQIEDDVISSMGLYNRILNGIKHTKEWTTLEYSSLGFIGKLYKSEDLQRFSEFLIMFYAEQPVDWLYTYFFKLLTQNQRILIQPSVFQHFGLHSSYEPKTTKLNKLKEKRFAAPDPLDLAEIVLAQDTKEKDTIAKDKEAYSMSTRNPVAGVYTTLEAYGSYRPYYAYVTDPARYFWGKSPLENDTFTIVLAHPIQMHYFDIRTGHRKHKDDYLHAGVIEYSEVNEYTNSSGIHNHNADQMEGTHMCKDYRILGDFSRGQFSYNADGHGKLFKVKCVQVRVTADQEEWLVISSISIK